MDNKKTDDYYLGKLSYHFNRIIDVMNGVTYDMYLNDEDKQDITMFNIIQISENAKQLSDEYKSSKPEIPWTDIWLEE